MNLKNPFAALRTPRSALPFAQMPPALLGALTRPQPAPAVNVAAPPPPPPPPTWSSNLFARDVQVRTGQVATPNAWATLGTTLAVAGTALGAYHGYKRTNNIGWAIGWALAGGLVPIITIPVAFAQGFARPEPSFRKK